MKAQNFFCVIFSIILAVAVVPSYSSNASDFGGNIANATALVAGQNQGWKGVEKSVQGLMEAVEGLLKNIKEQVKESRKNSQEEMQQHTKKEILKDVFHFPTQQSNGTKVIATKQISISYLDSMINSTNSSNLLEFPVEIEANETNIKNQINNP